MKRIRTFFGKPVFSGVLGGLVVGLLGWLAIAGGLIEAEPAESGAAATASADATPPRTEPVADAKALTAGQIYEEAGPAVAYIQAEQKPTGPSAASPFPQQGGTATGSGFLADEQGHILTNAHVVDGSSEVTVKLGADGDELEAEVLGSDLSTDVAVLGVDPDEVSAVPLPLGDSDDSKVGDAVVAIGNPFGLDRTVTTGIVSALQREISAPDGFTISDVIQTDAAINPGNSGGPLFDAGGEVIGINSQIATGSGGGGNVGVGFAVPVDTAESVFDQILEDGTVEHAFIGISGADVDADIARVLNLDADSGALVQKVTPGSPAEKAGIEGGDSLASIGGNEIRVGGDVITAVDGTGISGIDDLVAAVNDKAPGESLTLTVKRGSDTRQVDVKLADRPTDGS